MAFISNSSLPFVAFIITSCMFLMLMHRVKSADSLSFTFSKFDTNQNIDLILQGDAIIDPKSNTLQLTKVDSSGNPQSGSIGRALYSAPVHLWDSSSIVASFETTFTFLISSPSPNSLGDGLTFFIATPDTTIPSGSGGRFLGLFNSVDLRNNSKNNETVEFKVASSSDKVVAVEFDTYLNSDAGDPSYKHVGIDINSIRSSATGEWNFENGAIATAHISYNSASKALSVVTSYPSSGSALTVSYNEIALDTVLPEWVRVGFSAATGQNAQTNNILSWSFKSSWSNNKNIMEREENYPHNIATVV